MHAVTGITGKVGGTVAQTLVSKRQGDTYRAARDADWGDEWGGEWGGAQDNERPAASEGPQAPAD